MQISRSSAWACPRLVLLLLLQVFQSSHGFAVPNRISLVREIKSRESTTCCNLYVDPYEQQYQAYLAKSKQKDGNPPQEAAAVQDTTAAAAVPEATTRIADSAPVNYMDFLQGKTSQQQQQQQSAAPPPAQTSTYQTPTPPQAPTAPYQQPQTTTITTTDSPPTATEPEEDQSDRFLKMVSNEVEYKKLLGQSPYALTDIQFSVLLQRVLDNIEDSTQKNNGKFKGQSKLAGKKGPKEERKTVVVLGTGWGAHAFVKLASTYDLRIVVVSPVNHFVRIRNMLHVIHMCSCVLYCMAFWFVFSVGYCAAHHDI